jgi:hypothetical protein
MDSGKALEIIAMLIDRILSDFKPFLEFIQRKRLVIIVSLSKCSCTVRKQATENKR